MLKEKIDASEEAAERDTDPLLDGVTVRELWYFQGESC